MEKTCDFCTVWRPVVYCMADVARLCLSCDAKVHSANALSGKHQRSVLCDLCRHNPAHVRCLDHRMLVCRNCDRTLHGFSGQHQKRTLSCFTGCPSAQDFASLWNWDLNELHNSDFEHQYVDTCVEIGQSCPVESSPASEADRANFISALESKVESSSQHDKRFSGSQQQQQKNRFILQQILKLRRIQLIDGVNPSPLLRGEGQTDIPSQKLDGVLDKRSQLSHNLAADARRRESPALELKAEPLPLSLSHLEQIPLSSTVGSPLNGETFWQYKNPNQSSQFWSQNMQDLGVCEELVWHDEFNIPDVDVSFKNFEDLFGGDQDPARALLDEKDVSCSSIEKEISLDKSNNEYSVAMEDAANASSNYMRPSTHSNTDVFPPNQVGHYPGRMGSPLPSDSTMSFSCSRLSAKSTGTDCLDTGISPNNAGDKPSYSSHNLEARDHIAMRKKLKKKARLHENRNLYTSQKGTADARKQVKARFAREVTDENIYPSSVWPTGDRQDSRLPEDTQQQPADEI